ncbi:MAG: hypothetical protein ACYC99_03110 [Candidatus Geothermincolia bacterium]
MITSKELLAATGIKNAKTLTRWHQAGLIPPPHLGTHPSGRGKIAFWDDAVKNRILRLIDYRAQGLTLEAAARKIDKAGMGTEILDFNDNFSPSLLKKYGDFKLGALLLTKSLRRFSGPGLKMVINFSPFLALPQNVWFRLEHFFPEKNVIKDFYPQFFRKAESFLSILRSGSDPLLLFNGSNLEFADNTNVVMLARTKDGEPPYVIIPLLSFVMMSIEVLKHDDASPEANNAD